MPSVYEEEIAAEDTAYSALVEHGSWAQPEAAGGYFPELTAFRLGGLQARLETLRRAVEACAIPIIASLNGSTPEGWTRLRPRPRSRPARRRSSSTSTGCRPIRARAAPRSSSAGSRRCAAVCAAVSIPVSVKLGPVAVLARHITPMQIVGAGARGLVLFNRFYQPDIDLATLAPKPSLELSTPYEIRQALLWIALLAGRVDASLAATSGVEHRPTRSSSTCSPAPTW